MRAEACGPGGVGPYSGRGQRLTRQDRARRCAHDRRVLVACSSDTAPLDPHDASRHICPCPRAWCYWVLARDRRRFSLVAPGDRLVVYVSRVCELDAYGEVVSPPFVATDAIMGPRSERYSERARVQFTKTGLRRTARNLLYGVTALESRNTTPRQQASLLWRVRGDL